MKLDVINRSKVKLPEMFLRLWIQCLENQMGKILIKRQNGYPKRKVKSLKGKVLSLVFLNQAQMLNLNLKFRNQKKVTDVLSFSGVSVHSIGEIVLCPDYIKKRAHLGFDWDLAYLILHAFLHLLGFEHESDEKKAHLMYSLQDEIFFKNIKKVEKKSQKIEKKNQRLKNKENIKEIKKKEIKKKKSKRRVKKRGKSQMKEK